MSEVPEHQPYAALSYPEFRRYALGALTSNIGMQMMAVAVSWQIYRLTQSSLALGLVGLVEVVPIVGLALPAGQLADRLSRRRLVLGAALAMVGCTAALAVLASQGDHLQHSALLTASNQLLERMARGLGEQSINITSPVVPLLYLILAVLGVARAVGGPARAALLPMLVPTAAFSNAVTWNSSFFQLSAVVGPALGGLILGFTSRAAAPFAPVYVLAMLSAVVLFGSIYSLPEKTYERNREPVTLSSLSAGIRFVCQQRIILATITLDLFAVLLGGAVALLPVYADKILHVGPMGLGVLRAAPSVGALMMALVLAHRPPMKRAGPALLMSVAGFGLATIVFGLSRNFWLSLAMLWFTGVLDNISVVVRHTLVQVLTPDAMRGRVSAVNQVFISLSNEMGALESGTVAAAFGPVVSVVAGGIGTILVVLAVAGLWPEIGRFGSLGDARPVEMPEDGEE
ncbi:MAG: MFS transporter [Armatimonadetes bacterium]|nr:MFS transporter [Armatimonadota bacterium]